MATLTYEWDIETVDKFGDIQDHCHAERLNEFASFEMKKKLEPNESLVLVVDQWKDEGLIERQLAYVENGNLPDEFDGGYKIPKRFRKELDLFNKMRSEDQ